MLTAFLLQTSVSIFPLGLEFVGFHFHATSIWHIWQILEFFMDNKKLVGTIRKLLLLLLFIIGFISNEFYAHTSGSRTREKCTLSRASELILAIDFKKRVDPSKFLHSTRVTFARAIACSRVTSRHFLSNATRYTESFVGGHLPLLNPASARRASNDALLKRNTEKLMDTYQKKSAFSAPSRNHFHHLYIKIMLNDYAHTLREAPADSRGDRITLRNERYCVLSLFLIVLCYVLAK